MNDPGDQRLSRDAADPDRRRWQDPVGRGPQAVRSSPARALLAAGGVSLLAATAWAVLRGVLELGVTSLAIAALGGWSIGAILRRARAPWLMAPLLGLVTWLLGLVASWLLAMALLPESSRTFGERLEGTPFVDWLAPQLGALEVAALLVYAGAAAYAARPTARPRP
jgi:hypothetical protein